MEPGTPIPDRYTDAEVDEFAFSAIPTRLALSCPVCLKTADKHTWQATERGRVIDCSEAVTS